MRAGDVVNGYTLTSPLTNAGGGMSQWAFAERDGRQYFLKRFLAPRFPLDDGPGSEEAKARKREVCTKFEQRHLSIADRLATEVGGAGNLVLHEDFFRFDTTYVKIMRRVNAVVLPPARQLAPEQLLVLLRTLVLSLRVMHRAGVVHGDIKPENVLVELTPAGLYVAKVIDLDEAYLVEDPPSPELLVGDAGYYSPEVLRYLKSASEPPPGLASDVFSLGLLLHAYLAGEPVAFDLSRFRYPCEAAVAGAELHLSQSLPGGVVALIASMLLPDAAGRPDLEDVADALLGAMAEQLWAPPPSEDGTCLDHDMDEHAEEPGAASSVLDPATATEGIRSTLGRRRPTDSKETP